MCISSINSKSHSNILLLLCDLFIIGRYVLLAVIHASINTTSVYQTAC
jgi:hypothetical protein